MTDLTTAQLESITGGCHKPPCTPPPCHKPPCHKPPCHKPNHPHPPTHGGNGGTFGNWPADFGTGWSYNPPPTFPTYQTGSPSAAPTR